MPGLQGKCFSPADRSVNGPSPVATPLMELGEDFEGEFADPSEEFDALESAFQTQFSKDLSPKDAVGNAPHEDEDALTCAIVAHDLGKAPPKDAPEKSLDANNSKNGIHEDLSEDFPSIRYSSSI